MMWRIWHAMLPWTKVKAVATGEVLRAFDGVAYRKRPDGSYEYRALTPDELDDGWLDHNAW